MSEEFEDISVASTETVEVASPITVTTEPVASDSTPVDFVPSEVQATEVNLDAADKVLKQNAQQAYLENYSPERAGGAVPITAGAIAAKEAEKEEKRSALQESLDNQAKEQERHREWMERQHDFGGMKISGHDLDKLMNFYGNNPQMMDKLKERMTKSGMPKDKVDKGMKEFQEFMDLKKKEQEGQKLTEEEQRRLRDIQKSAEFKQVTEAAVQHAKDNGINLAVSKSAEAVNSQMNKDKGSVVFSELQLQQADTTSQTQIAKKSNGIEGFGGMELARSSLASSTLTSANSSDSSESSQNKLASARNSSFSSTDADSSRENFPSAPHLTSEFSNTGAAIKPASAPAAANDMSFGDDSAPAIVVAQAQLPKKVITADVSFG